MLSSIFSVVSHGLLTALVLHASLANAALSVSNTILVFARDATSAASATSGLQGYGIPYQVVIVPQGGVLLPTLNLSSTQGNYGGIIVLSDVAYSYSTGWASALSASQWQTIYTYQTSFGVRLVRLDSFPSTDLGVTKATPGAGCCNTGVEQLISISDASAFPTASIKTGAGLSTQGLWHYPAVITNATIAHTIATFGPDSAGASTTTTTAAIINNFNGRQQMVWFVSWATDWSQTSNFLQHAYIHWLTRGLFVGKRKIYLNTQVDDMHLETDIYQPNGTTFRIRTSDLDTHKNWQVDINTRLPSGSNYFIEVGHNGNGDIEAATNLASSASCVPDYAVEYDSPPDTPLEFQKPLGTGTDLWPPEFSTYGWSLTCAKLDAIATWFYNNPNAFAAVSHTFTHEELNNATYHDASREIAFNTAWLKQIGLWTSARFSSIGLIPPGITGLHNGDAIRAWMDNGIRYVVGDNTRPILRNPTNPFWPLISTVAGNGYAGLTILPRWATTMYYNCYSQSCTLQEWINTSAGSGTFANLLDDARTVNSRYLFGLHPDPYMFHQANLRSGDVDTITVGSQTGPLSLLQIWVETITQEMVRLTNWPISSLKHDDIGDLFTRRMTLDGCNPNLTYNYSQDGKSIVSVTITANGNSCGVPVPVTVPGTATSSGSSTLDQVGSEPAIYWTTLSGSAVTLTLSAGVPV
ncbi:hypothetical protein B0T22DRAFT_432386 [Podospora appendiculata]|uniref:Extracellular serine-rich protein n=1 Tax=Podospora appendiculata TaxID=314037 RepID=A0AAE1C7S1_9PEZI|nr:hypothetical protein B0T22DRAFT_432386 [Podospora appendiculata]